MIRVTTCLILIASFIPLLKSSVLSQTEKHGAVFKIKASIPESLAPKLTPNRREERPVEPPLLIGSFNIQTLVKKKFNNPDIMYVIEKIILRYDLILLMEIHTNEDSFMETLLKDVNSELPPGEAYNMTLSERQNQTTEHYAFLYRTNKLKVIDAESYDDPDIFYRKPLVVIFEAFTLRDMKKFGAVGHHVKPSAAVKEINGLAGIYDYIIWKYETEDVLLMGDFNADCTYVKEKDWENIELWWRSEFTWAITSNMDTTTNYRSCALDRIVYAGENMNDGVILSSAGVFNFQEEYSLSVYETRSISDHWPVEVKIRGKMSDLAVKHLTSDICFHVRDSQQRKNITMDNIVKLANKSFFNATEISVGVLLSNKTRNKIDMLDAISKLRQGLPIVVSHELQEAVKYKVNHGTLNDDSSFADIYDSRYTIKVMATNEYVGASICRTTSIN